MKLKKCPLCKTYTLKEICKKCKNPTKQAGYKFKDYLFTPTGPRFDSAMGYTR